MDDAGGSNSVHLLPLSHRHDSNSDSTPHTIRHPTTQEEENIEGPSVRAYHAFSLLIFTNSQTSSLSLRYLAFSVYISNITDRYT
jgi:hypothetical protein